MFWPTVFTILVIVLVVVVVVCAWITAENRYLRRDRDRLLLDLEQTSEQVQSRNNEIAEFKQKLAVMRETHEQIAKQFAQAQQTARETFKAVAGDVLDASNAQFLHLAKKTFESEQKDAVAQLEQRKQAIESLVKPVREVLDKYNQSLQQIESGRKEAYGSLKEQLAALVEDQRRLRGETSNLVQALRRPEVRGRWGEMQLRRVAELAGMIEYCDFTEQASVRTESGLLRPDMLVHLPNDRCIVVDAKTPLDAFITAIETEEEAQRDAHLERHAVQLENKVKELSAKQYMGQFSQSPDFVVLFIPGESFLHAAVQRRPQMLEDAMEKSVIIATPSTLIALLKAVAMGWREQRIAESAQKIYELGRELHSRLGTAFNHVGNLGKAMSTTVNHYNKLVGSLESSVLPQARRFQELGADSPKELPAQIDRVDTTVRDVSAAVDTDGPTSV